MLNDLVLKYMDVSKGLEKENRVLRDDVRDLEEYIAGLITRIENLEEEVTDLKVMYECAERELDDLELYVDELESELDLFEDEELSEDIDKKVLDCWEKMKSEYLKNEK